MLRLASNSETVVPVISMNEKFTGTFRIQFLASAFSMLPHSHAIKGLPTAARARQLPRAYICRTGDSLEPMIDPFRILQEIHVEFLQGGKHEETKYSGVSQNHGYFLGGSHKKY